ncbi:MAG TPA: TIR domain-containing protein [Gammaproteobacteria bacterium]|nr:TIR domain-containing protein [Gammaproteobacteria bacterium]
MEPQHRRYWAFISYSHRDKAWADWLHKALESYRVPRRLVGREGRDGPLPRRLFPVFRDREELPSSADLSDNINESLQHSRYLVVVCSPRAAVSRWVNEEIIAFKRQGRADRILALIVDGEPNAGDRPESGELECFPPALRHRVDSEGRLLTERVEPIAADARPQQDGKASARLKLLAGIMGVPYDELRQREKRRRLLRRLQWAAAAVVAAVLLTGAWDLQAQRKAKQAAIAAYTEQGRQLYLQGEPLQAAAYLGEAYRLGGRTPALRLLLARSMLYVDSLRGRFVEAGLWFNPDMTRDGKRMTAAGGAGDADIWDVDSGRHLLSIGEPGHMELWSRFSPDGRYVAVGSKRDTLDQDTVIRVLDAHTGATVTSLNFKDSFLVGALFDADSKRLLTRSERGGEVQIWDPASGKLQLTLKGRGGHIKHAGFSPDGRSIVGVDADHSLSLWDSRDGRLVAQLTGHRADVGNFAFSPDSRRLASSSDDKSVRVWDTHDGRLLYTIAAKNRDDYEGGHDDAVKVVIFSPDGKRLLTGSKDKTVRVWDAATGKNLARFAAMPDEIDNLIMSEDGAFIAASAKDVTWIWDGKDYTQRGVLPGGVALFTRDSTRLMTVTKDNVAQVWDMAAVLSAVIDVSGSHPVYDPMGARVATTDEGRVTIWRAHDGKRLFDLALPQGDPSKPDKAYASFAVFSPDGTRILAAASLNPSLSVWDAADGRMLSVMSRRPMSVAAFTPDGKRVFGCGDDKTAHIWDAHDGRQLAGFAMPEGCADATHFTPDGSHFLGIREDRSKEPFRYYAEVWDLQMHRRSLAPPEILYSYNAGAALSPDGQIVTTADNAGVIREWQIADSKLLRSWDSGSGEVDSIRYDPDGRRLVTVHRNGTLKVWDAGDGSLSWLYNAERLSLDRAQYSPDGQFLLVRSRVAQLRDPDSGQLLLEISGDSSLTEDMEFAPGAGQIASQAYYAGTRLLDVHAEDRPPEAVAALIRCRSPWRLDAGQLLPVSVAPADCAKP